MSKLVAAIEGTSESDTAVSVPERVEQEKATDDRVRLHRHHATRSRSIVAMAGGYPMVPGYQNGL